MLELMRASIFGIVWAIAIYAFLNVKPFSLWFFISLVPAWFIWGFIEGLRVGYGKKENEHEE